MHSETKVNQCEQKELLNPVDAITSYLDGKEAMLDGYIDSGTDQELFVASYIHGHFSVVAANIMRALSAPENSHLSAEQWQYQLHYMMNESIDRAVGNKELNDSDAHDVLAMNDALFVDDTN
jgi:hypothetical protein